MSADLFAAFDLHDQRNASVGSRVTSHNGVSNAHANTASDEPQPAENDKHASANDEDDFGDFEGENPWQGHESASGVFEDRSSVPITDLLGSLHVAEDEQIKDSGGNGDVIFDAEESYIGNDELEDDDDFGDFEQPSPPVPAKNDAQARPAASALPGHSTGSTSKLVTRPIERHGEVRSSTRAGAAQSPGKDAARNGPAQPANTQGELASTDWVDFDTMPASAPRPSISKPAECDQTAVQIPSYPFLDQPIPTPAPLPPSNVPPPSVLFSILPPLFTACTATIQPILNLSIATRSDHLTRPSLLAFLKAHIRLCHTFTHILAGRKLRWRRDTRLAQAMSIGAAGGRGMKLTGLDRSASGREDAAAQDAVMAYRAHVGSLRSLVGQAMQRQLQDQLGNGVKTRDDGGQGELGGLGEMLVPVPEPSLGSAQVAAVRTQAKSQSLLPVVPDVAITMPVRSAGPAEGGIASGKACGLCGLKREERVAKVDVAVQDSFGEWWIDGGTGWHSDCWRFWMGFEGTLKGRA